MTNSQCWLVGYFILDLESQVAQKLISSVQLLSRVQLFVTPWITACQAALSITNSRSSLRPRSIESVMPSSHLILCRSLLLLPSIFPSTRVFSNELVLQVASGEGKGKPLQYSCLRTPWTIWKGKLLHVSKCWGGKLWVERFDIINSNNLHPPKIITECLRCTKAFSYKEDTISFKRNKHINWVNEIYM